MKKDSELNAIKEQLNRLIEAQDKQDEINELSLKMLTTLNKAVDQVTKQEAITPSVKVPKIDANYGSQKSVHEATNIEKTEKRSIEAIKCPIEILNRLPIEVIVKKAKSRYGRSKFAVIAQSNGKNPATFLDSVVLDWLMANKIAYHTAWKDDRGMYHENYRVNTEDLPLFLAILRQSKDRIITVLDDYPIKFGHN